MKEEVLKAMDPVERSVLEKELQKVHMTKGNAIKDCGKVIWDTKRICELLDEDVWFAEVPVFFHQNKLKPDEYHRNAIPLAAYTYWYARGCGREDVCLWAIERPRRSMDSCRCRSRRILKRLQKDLQSRIKKMRLPFASFIFMRSYAGQMHRIISRP